MGDRPCGTLTILLIHVMMNEASNGLKTECADNNDADDGMTVTSRELDAEWAISFRKGWILIVVADVLVTPDRLQYKCPKQGLLVPVGRQTFARQHGPTSPFAGQHANP